MSLYAGLSGFDPSGKLRLSPNDPDAPALMAKYPGRYIITSEQQAAPYLQSPQTPVAPTAQPASSNWYAATAPAWAQQTPGPQPFHDVLAGKKIQNFNPGGYFGVGGKTLPSAQRYNRLAPSEQAGFSGYLQDELRVNPDDVYGLMRRLTPAGFSAAAPRWTGGF